VRLIDVGPADSLHRAELPGRRRAPAATTTVCSWFGYT